MTDQELQAKVDALPWHHQIDFGSGVLSNGNTKIEVLRSQAEVYFADGIAGQSFLDIGCWDGFNSFEAARRGASRVLATDYFAWSDRCWGDRRSFELARSVLAPEVEVLNADLAALDPVSIGMFDVVLFAGVFYHLRHPFHAMEHIAKLAAKRLIVETHLDAMDDPRPAMVFYPGRELADDDTNWWGPNVPCVEAMLRDLGFEEVRTTIHPLFANRAIFVGTRI